MFFNFFKKEKKKLRKEGKEMTLDEILKGIDELPEEDRKKVHDKMSDLYKAEDEREIDKIEEERAENPETKDEKKEEKDEESEEIGKDVDEVKDDFKSEKEEKEENTEKNESPLADIIKKAVAEEVKNAIAKMTAEAHKEVRETSDADKKELQRIEAIYS